MYEVRSGGYMHGCVKLHVKLAFVYCVKVISHSYPLPHTTQLAFEYH